MIVVNLVGGLASQLHKYMLALSIGQKLKKQVKVDLSFFTEEMYQYNNIMKYELPNLGLNPDIASKKEVALAKGHTTASYVVMNLFKIKVLNEFFFNLPARIAGRLGRALKSSGIMFKEYIYIHIADKDFDPEWLEKIPANIKAIYLDGEPGLDLRLIQGVLPEVYNQLVNASRNIMFQDKYMDLILGATASVAVHVRRGDYVSNTGANNFHGVCGFSYYKKCIELVHKANIDATFFIFSDDIKLCMSEFLELQCRIVFVSENSAAEDFMLMINCCYHIISNSGFSAMAACLSMCPEENVYSPSKWFNDSIANRNAMSLLPVRWSYIKI